MSRTFDSLIPIRRVLKKVGDAYTRMTYRPALSFEGDAVTITDDPTYTDEFGNTVGKTIVEVSASATLDPPAGLVLAGATAPSVRIGDDSPLHSPTFNAWVDGFNVTSVGAISMVGVGTSTLDFEEVEIGATAYVLIAATTTATISGTTCAVQGSTACQLVSPTTTIGPSLTGRRHVIDVGVGANEVRRRVYDGANALALTETCLAAGSTVAAAGTLGFSASGTEVLATVSGAGGATKIRGVRGATPGTNVGGDVMLSHGRHIADNSTAEIAGYYGDATDDDFENKLWALKRDTSGRCLFAATSSLVMTATSQFVVSSATEVQIEGGNGTYGSLYIGSGLWQQYMPGGHEVVLGPSAANRGGRKCPPRVTHAGAGAESVGTFTVSASSAGRFRGTLTARNGVGNSKSWDVSIEFDADGSTVTVQAAGRVFTVLPGNVGTITTVAGDLDTTTSGLVVTVRSAVGTGYVFSLTGWLEV